MGVATESKIYRWQMWVCHDEYRDVHIVQCPNMEGSLVEGKDLAYCKDRVINNVAGYMNDCKNNHREIKLVDNGDLPTPPPWFQVINMNSQ